MSYGGISVKEMEEKYLNLSRRVLDGVGREKETDTKAARAARSKKMMAVMRIVMAASRLVRHCEGCKTQATARET